MSQRNRFFVPAQKYKLRMEVKGNTNKKTAIVAGASGLTGGFLLQLLAQDKSFERIIVLSRKAMKPALPKVREVVVDFDNLGRYEFWPDADVLFCCVGTTIKKAGSQEEFRKVDHDLPLKLAEQCALFNVSFHLVSSIGADAQSRYFYLKTKGETEEETRDHAYSSGNQFLRIDEDCRKSRGQPQADEDTQYTGPKKAGIGEQHGERQDS